MQPRGLLVFFLFLSSCNYQQSKRNSRAGDSAGPRVISDKSKIGTDLKSNDVGVIATRCSSCHDHQRAQGGADFDTADVRTRWGDRIRYRTLVRRDMPPGGGLTTSEEENLKSWLDSDFTEGATNEDWPIPEVPRFEEVKLRIFNKHCLQCHSGLNPEAGLDLENYEMTKNSAQKLIQRVIVDADMPMPPVEALSSRQKKLLSAWLIEGAPQ